MSGVPVQDPVAPVVFIYRDYNFEGPTLVLTGSCSNFVDIGFNDTASSVIVKKGTWIFCEHVDYKGKQITLGPGSYKTIDTLGNDVLSSVRLESN